jgi:nitric oxide reductase large subunit
VAGREQATLSFRAPGDVALTPAQRACAWFFLVMAALFLIQTLVGAASEHYRADLAGFFGIDLAQVLPYNLMRTWHVQLAIFWVATSFLAAGIFLAPMIAGREPRGQHFLAYGLLAAGLALFCLRYLIPEDRWSERAAKWSFWSLNIGLAWMCFATLFPLGILQLYESVNSGYFEARSLEYITNDTNALLEWMRLPGDVVFIAGGVLPLLYLCYLGVRHTVPRATMEEPEDILFTDIAEPETAGQRE